MVQFHRKVNKSSDFMESFLAQNETTRALFRVYSCNFSALHCFWRTKTTRTEGEGVPAVLAEGDGVAPIASQATPCHRPHDIHPPARRREPPQRRRPSLHWPRDTGSIPAVAPSRIHIVNHGSTSCKLSVSFFCIFRTLSFSHLSHAIPFFSNVRMYILSLIWEKMPWYYSTAYA